MAIPSGVTLRKWTLYNGLLTVDFSSGYGVLSGIDPTLADYRCRHLTHQAEGGGDDYRRGREFSFRITMLTAGEAWSALQSGKAGGNSPGCGPDF